MKNLKLFPLATFVILMSSTGCVKEYSCTCTYDDGNGTTYTETTTIEGSRAEAEAACNANDLEILGTVYADCELE